MKTLNIEQRSNLWHTWRNDGIGASESAAVLRMSKYDSPISIWEQKTGRGFPKLVNEDMQRGIDLEDTARHAFQEKVKRIYVPACCEHDDYPFMKASLDGIDITKKFILEIKCPRSTKLFDALNAGDIRMIQEDFAHIWVQLQHQFCVCDTAEFGHLAAYVNGELAYMEIPRDKEFIEQVLLPELTIFWHEHVMADKEPPLTDADYLYIDDPDTVSLAQEWYDANERLKAVTAEAKTLKAALIECGDDGNAIIGNIVKMTRYSTTKVAYKQACMDNDVNLVPYTTTTIGCYRMNTLC